MRPSNTFAKRLKRIDRDLVAEWNPHANRWGIYHNLPPVERVDERIGREATELYNDLWKKGYPVTKRVCEEMISKQIREAALVFYVQEEDGSFAQLDGRVLYKLERMDWTRRHWGVKDWKHYMDVRRAAVDGSRIRAQEDAFQQIDKDKVWKQVAAEALRGDQHLRSVHVEQPDKPSRISVIETREERGIVDATD